VDSGLFFFGAAGEKQMPLVIISPSGTDFLLHFYTIWNAVEARHLDPRGQNASLDVESTFFLSHLYCRRSTVFN